MVDGEKKAKEVEEVVIRFAVKIVILLRNKQLSPDLLLKNTLQPIKTIWSDVLDYCEISFVYDQAVISSAIETLQKTFTDILKPYMTEKNVEK